MRDGAKPGAQCRDFLREVDWSRTSAYALGLGGIYLNLEGREAQGTVKPDVADEVRTAIIDRLGGLVDPAGGTVAVRRVRPRETVYSGPYVTEAPDLLVDFARDIGLPGGPRWEASPRASSKTIPGSGAETISLILDWFPESW